ncbi:MAG TPA: type II restriction endonuclease, partial [Casimicrobium sp.]|nr:type II restriction endonuclease [Casimicrobium sp.]
MNTVNVTNKSDFEEALKHFSLELSKTLTTSDGQWSIKGFIDTLKNVYTISSDTKIVSKILE